MNVGNLLYRELEEIDTEMAVKIKRVVGSDADCECEEILNPTGPFINFVWTFFDCCEQFSNDI
jgi:hypothetical protein